MKKLFIAILIALAIVVLFGLSTFAQSGSSGNDVRGDRGIFNSIKVKYGAWLDSIINDTTGTSGKVRSVLTAKATWDLVLAYSSSGGSSTTPPNIGSGFRIYSPHVPGFKTLIEGFGVLIDTLVSNSITIKADTASLATLFKVNSLPHRTRVIVVWGQSNGYGRNLGNYDTLPNPKLLVYNGTSFVMAKRGVAPMGYSVPGSFISDVEPGNTKYDTATNAWFYAGKRLIELTGDTVKVIVVCYGSNPIDNWIPSTSTNFTTLKTYVENSGIDHIDYLWGFQGESDSGSTDTAFLRKFRMFTAQLDSQSWFNKSVPMFYSAVKDTSIFNSINSILFSVGQGSYDKRWHWLDTRFLQFINGPGSDPIHYSAKGMYDAANLFMQAIRNPPIINNSFFLTTSSQRTNIEAYSKNIFRGFTMDSLSQSILAFNGTSFVTAASPWSVSGSYLYYGNRVGIGGGAPNFTLDVTGQARFSTNIGIGDDPNVNYGILLKAPGSTSGQYAVSLRNSSNQILWDFVSDHTSAAQGNVVIDARTYTTSHVALDVYGNSGDTYNTILRDFASGSILIVENAGNITVAKGNLIVSNNIQLSKQISFPGTTGNTIKWNAASGMPSNTVTPVGWLKVNVAGTDSWIQYYQ